MEEMGEMGMGGMGGGGMNPGLMAGFHYGLKIGLGKGRVHKKCMVVLRN